MTKSARPIIFLLLLIIVPFLVYAVLQIRSLDEDAKMAQNLYEKQMETSLFSVNQYADDMMNRWMDKLTNQRQSISQNANDLIIGNESIQLMILYDIATDTTSYHANDYVSLKHDLQAIVSPWYQHNDTTLTKLTNYYKAGFRKIQAVNDYPTFGGLKPNQTVLTSMCYGLDSALFNVTFILEPNYWVEQTLGSKMHRLDQGEFRLGVYTLDEPSNTPQFLYETTPFHDDESAISKPLWILSNTFLTIQPNGESYTELIKDRNLKNLYFLLFSILLVLVGGILILRNIQSTLKIAQVKTDFVSNVSHEIRTPLALIRMYAETLLLGRVSTEEKKQNYYQIIHHESGRLTYLVNNILDFARIEGNKKTYHMEEKDMNELTQALYTNYSHNFEESGVNCHLSLSSSPLLIQVDLQAFEEALSNLIENAIKYNRDQADIFIETVEKNGFAYCSVKDQGLGIPKKSKKQIFEKFYREENALTQKTKGTGLGLSLVQHFMSSHDGEVLVDSVLGSGSTFSLKFPLIKPHTS